VGKAHLALRKRGYFTVVGNQLVATEWSCDLEEGTGRPVGPRRHAPGIMSLSCYPPARLTYFCVSRPVARLELRRSGRAVDLVLDEQASDWYPHVLHTEYFVEGGGRVIQDLCVARDVAVARLTTRYLPDGLEAVVVGEPLTGEPAERIEADERGASLALTGRGQGLAQAVALSHPAVATSTAEGYALALGDPKALGGGLVVAAALRPDGADAAHEARWAVERAADCFADAEDQWADYFGRVLPRFVSPDARLMDLYYTTAYVLWADRYVMPEGGMWRHPYVVPSKWTWRGIWPEDLSHCLTGLRWLNDPETAYGCLRVIRDHFFSPAADRKSKVHAYGLLTMATWQVFERYGDLGFVREIYPTLRAMNDFIATKCDEDGDGLPAMWDSFHLGWDSSRRYDWKGNLVEARHLREPIEPVDCAVYFWRQTEHLAAMAEALGAEDDAGALRERAERTWRAINEALWDQETGYFYDAMADGGEQCLIKSCAGLFPLIGGRLPDERRQALVAHLKNPQEFWAAYPVPCLALDEPNFGSVWSGASCLRNNWLVYRGLLDCGLDETAGDLAARTFGLLGLTPLDAMNEGYYFDPRDGRPRAEQLGNLFSTPVAGVLDMIVTGVCGLRPRAAGDWEIRPVASLQPEWWVLAGLARRGERVKVAGGRGREVTISADAPE